MRYPRRFAAKVPCSWLSPPAPGCRRPGGSDALDQVHQQGQRHLEHARHRCQRYLSRRPASRPEPSRPTAGRLTLSHPQCGHLSRPHRTVSRTTYMRRRYRRSAVPVLVILDVSPGGTNGHRPGSRSTKPGHVSPGLSSPMARLACRRPAARNGTGPRGPAARGRARTGRVPGHQRGGLVVRARRPQAAQQPGHGARVVEGGVGGPPQPDLLIRVIKAPHPPRLQCHGDLLDVLPLLPGERQRHIPPATVPGTRARAAVPSRHATRVCHQPGPGKHHRPSPTVGGVG